MQEFEERLKVAEETHALEQNARPDQLQIARLKKQKLFLRDQIVKLENALTPDIIA